MPEPVPHDIIVLAGGGGTRLGGFDKARLEVAGRPLLEFVLAGATAARQVVVVGETAVPVGVLRTVEDPPGGGPVAGIAAGLRTLSEHRGAPASPAHEPRAPASPASAWTLVLAVDQPGAGAAVPVLLAAAAAAGPETDLVCPHDASGHPQWLLAAYRTSALERALEPFGSGHHVSVRRLTSGLVITDAPTDHLGDIDTWEDHAAWQERLSE